MMTICRKTIRDVFHTDDVERERAMRERCLSGTSRIFEWQKQCDVGRFASTDGVDRPLHRAAGRPTDLKIALCQAALDTL